MQSVEVIGLLATVIILFSLTQSNTLYLRVINTVGSVLFVIYGLYIGALSVWVLNSCCAVVNIFKIINMLSNGTSKKGCIVVGYPGVGKTTLSNKYMDCIDLDSSTFDLNTQRGVFEYYHCACLLAMKGYIVFVSSHSDLTKCILDFKNMVSYVAVYPSLDLEDRWKSRVISRWMTTRSAKDRRAMVRVCDHYVDDITDMKNKYEGRSIELNTTNYTPEKIYKKIRKMS